MIRKRGRRPINHEEEEFNKKAGIITRTFYCSECPKSYTSYKSLYQHAKIKGHLFNSKKKEYLRSRPITILRQCSIPGCTYSSVNKHYLFDHIRRDHDGKGYGCNFCDKTFQYPGQLRKHIITNHNELHRYPPDLLSCEYTGCLFKTNIQEKLEIHLTSMNHGVVVGNVIITGLSMSVYIDEE
jgi:hypothetical protein